MELLDPVQRHIHDFEWGPDGIELVVDSGISRLPDDVAVPVCSQVSLNSAKVMKNSAPPLLAGILFALNF